MPREICQYLYDLAKTNPGVTSSTVLGGQPTHIIQSASSAKYVLVTNADNFSKHMASTRQVIGPSRMTESGEVWRALSRLSQPALSNIDIQSVGLAACHYGSQLAVQIGNDAKKAPVKIPQMQFNELVARVLAETIMNRKLEDFGPGCLDDVAIFMNYIHLLTSFGDCTAPKIDRAETLKMMQARERWLARMSDLKATVGTQDKLMHRLMHGGRTGPSQSLFDHEMLLLFGAGTDSTGGTLSWFTYVMAQNPELQKYLRDQLQRHWSQDSPKFDNIVTEPVLLRLVAEMLRAFPPVPLIARIALQDDDVEGHHVSAGDTVFVSNIGIGRDPNFFERPDEFDINRSANSNCPHLHTIPFGDGVRACGGRKLAMIELPIFMAILLRHFEFQLSDNDPVPLKWQLTMQPRDGAPVLTFPV